MNLTNYTLGELSIGGIGSYGIPASAVARNEKLPTYLRITDINDDGTLNFQNLMSVDAKDSDKYILEEGDIVFARTGASTGRNYFYESKHGNFVYAGFLIKFSIDKNKVNPKFIKYYCQSKEYYDWISSHNNGSTRGNINAKTLSNMPINLPKREYQNKIITILSSLDDKIELNNCINDNLQQQAQALFKSWFVDFEPWDGVMPDGWKIMNFENILEEKNEKISNSEVEEFSVTNNGIVPRNEKFKKKLSKDIQNKLVNKYDIVFGMSRKILNWGMMKDKIGGVSPAYKVFKITTNVNKMFVESYIKNKQEYFYDIIKPASREGQSIDKNILFSKFIYIPDEKTLEKYYNIENSITKARENNIIENRRLASLRDTLLPKLMSGELDVSNLDIE